MKSELIPSDCRILGQVEVEGVAYTIHQSAINAHEVVRCSDGRRVGRLRGSPSLMWLLEALEIEAELLRAIVESAIEDGLLEDLPTD